MALSVAGGMDATIGPGLAGRYQRGGSDHGQPIFKKESSQGYEILLYFWDARDGVWFQGWWFGPNVDQAQVWAFCPCQVPRLPPKTGWQVPAAGPVDATLTVLVDVPLPPPPPQYFTAGSLRTDEKRQGEKRYKKKQVLPEDHPLVKKRKADAAAKRHGRK